MNHYILLIQGNTTSESTEEEWNYFFAAARSSGIFSGGSEIGRREFFGTKVTAKSTDHIEGYMLFTTEEKHKIVDLLKIHPVVLNGGTVELCELPKS
jgi:hypothetical protein